MRALLLATLLLVACSACSPSTSTDRSAATPAPATSAHSTSTCAEVFILGLRGQTQSARTHDGMGAEVQGVVGQLATSLRHSGRRVRTEAVRYPAVSAATIADYDADVEKGRTMTTHRLNEIHHRCPESKAILVGFSEGAQAVHLTVQRLPLAGAAHVQAVVVMGDPLRDPANKVTNVDLGTGPATGRGSNGTGTSFGHVTARTVSVCVRADNVCNVGPAGRQGPISDAHRHAYETSDAARTIAQAVQSL